MKHQWLYPGILAIIIFSVIIMPFSTDTASEQRTGFHKAQTLRDESPEPKTFKTSATLLAVGDILIHDTVYKNAKTDAGYNFKPMFARVKPYIKEADIAVANQESMIGGAELGVSSYPRFNSPFAVGDAMKDAGFDIVTMANNHTLDKGRQAIENAIGHWDQIGMRHTGSFLSEKARNTILTTEANGITFSFLAYTYGTNGIPVPENQDYLVNLIDPALIKKDVQKAKELSDVVVVSLHFGNEYERLPNEQQKKLAQQLADEGVNIILGHHPHVLQPYEWVEGPSGHQTFVAYSLGNFLSGQDELYREIGGMLKLEVVKVKQEEDVDIQVKQPQFISTWVDQSSYQVVPLEAAETYGLPRATSLYKEITHHMSRWIPGIEFGR